MDLNLILRTSVLLAAAGIIARLLRHAAPSTRHLLWHTAIVLVLLAPALAPMAPRFTVPGVPRCQGCRKGLCQRARGANRVSASGGGRTNAWHFRH